MAAQENHLDVVRYLLENGGNQSIATEVSTPRSDRQSSDSMFIRLLLHRPSRMASPRWPSPSSRDTTRWSPSYWRMTPKGKSACPPCTSPHAKTTPSRPRCSFRTTTTQTSSPRYGRPSPWARHAWKPGSSCAASCAAAAVLPMKRPDWTAALAS